MEFYVPSLSLNYKLILSFVFQIVFILQMVVVYSNGCSQWFEYWKVIVNSMSPQRIHLLFYNDTNAFVRIELNIGLINKGL